MMMMTKRRSLVSACQEALGTTLPFWAPPPDWCAAVYGGAAGGGKTTICRRRAEEIQGRGRFSAITLDGYVPYRPGSER